MVLKTRKVARCRAENYRTRDYGMQVKCAADMIRTTYSIRHPGVGRDLPKVRVWWAGAMWKSRALSIVWTGPGLGRNDGSEGTRQQAANWVITRVRAQKAGGRQNSSSRRRPGSVYVIIRWVELHPTHRWCSMSIGRFALEQFVLECVDHEIIRTFIFSDFLRIVL